MLTSLDLAPVGEEELTALRDLLQGTTPLAPQYRHISFDWRAAGSDVDQHGPGDRRWADEGCRPLSQGYVRGQGALIVRRAASPTPAVLSTTTTVRLMPDRAVHSDRDQQAPGTWRPIFDRA